MKVLLIGANGQVGGELRNRLPALATVVACARDEVDLADLDGVRAAVRSSEPDVIVNAAAYNQVDKAESEPDVALRINAEAVGVLGEEAAAARAALIHYSTDFVFDGTKGTAYVESDPPRPLSAYGRSKLAGERALDALNAPSLTLRTAWVYSLTRPSFVSKMLELARTKETLAVVTDQVGSPTWCGNLARATVRLIEWLGPDPFARAMEVRGVYHAAGAGSCSRFELAKAAIELDPRASEHSVRSIGEALAADFPAPAARPGHAPLDGSRLRDTFGVTLLPWREALGEALRSQ